MTREEAIVILEDEAEYLYGDDMPYNREAFKMAVDALMSEPIVHCEDCKYHEDEELGMVWCPYIVGSWVENDFYCANGEEKEADND